MSETGKKILLVLANLLIAAAAMAATGALYGTPLADDPIQARIYRLDNGLTVCLSVNRETPSIQTYIGFRAGSADDPVESTGLAHYLEHLLFKGSEKLGTVDFKAELPLLQRIEALYDRHEAAGDPGERLKIYQEIDRISFEAGKYMIQNELDQAIGKMGGTGLNAYTGVDRTVYLTRIPANQLEKFIRLQYDRFRSPVFRGFHTELETVFEEFNLYADRPDRRFGKFINERLFPGHPYGRPVIGLPEHLKNPSPRRVMEFYRQYYVPENMVIALAGDLDPDSALRWIEETFGNLPARPAPAARPEPIAPIRGEHTFSLTTPENELCYLIWRIDRPDTRTLDLLQLASQVLSNGAAGLLDQNLNIPQKVTSSSASVWTKPGLFGILFLSAIPNRGATPEEARALLDAEVEKLKNGEFPDWLPEAITGHVEFRLSRSVRDNDFRAGWLLESFLDRIDWPESVQELERQKKITKAEIMEFARRHLTGDRLVFYRKNGPLPPLEKLSKPPLTPLSTAKGPSEFFQEISGMEVTEIRPEFPDLVNGIRREESRLAAALPFEGQTVPAARRVSFSSIPNDRNEYFQLRYLFSVGRYHDRRWELLDGYSLAAGTEKMSARQLKQELYRLTGDIAISVETEKTVVTISGLYRNLPEIVKLADQLLTSPAVDQDALQLLAGKILLQRQTEKENPDAILFRGLLPYIQHGPEYLEKASLSSAELERLEAGRLVELIRELKGYPARIQYFGPLSQDPPSELRQSLQEWLPLPLPENRPPQSSLPKSQLIESPAVYLVKVPNLRQLHLLFLASGRIFNPDDIGVRMLFNRYYGGGMASVVFQALRESNSLAYSCYAVYATPDSPLQRHYFYLYLSTQSDKLPEALKVVETLGFPVRLDAIENSRSTLLKSQATERWREERLFSLAELYRTMNLPPDYREQTYRQLQDASVFDLLEFYRQELKDAPRALLVVGDGAELDMKQLEAYGPVRELPVDELFPK